MDLPITFNTQPIKLEALGIKYEDILPAESWESPEDHQLRIMLTNHFARMQIDIQTSTVLGYMALKKARTGIVYTPEIETVLGKIIP